MIKPYEILNVSEKATQDEIKAAYKKLAKKNHPDLNPGNKAAEAKFKDVARAFALIGTPEARAKYDRGETDEQKQHAYDEYMKQQGQRSRPSYEDTQRNRGRYSSRYQGFDEDVFGSFFGGAGSAGGQFNFQGQDEIYQLEINFEEAALGGEKIITLPNGKKLQVKIPPGIQEGQKLKFRGQGGEGIGSGPNGDVYVQISVRPSKTFRREGKDIISEVPVSIFEAINGGEVEVPTLHGRVSLKIPPGVSTGSKLRIKEKGITGATEKGHHIAVIKVVTPKDPPQEFREALAKLGERFAYHPRSEQ